MDFGVGRAFWLGALTVASIFAVSSCVQKWNMQERCGQHLEGYGGEVFFDASKLPVSRSECSVTIVGNGSAEYMLSLYFTSFNVSDGCLANITLKEESTTGLHQSFCAKNPYLNEYLIYTTNSRFLSLVFTKKIPNKPVAMAFSIKYVTFVSRVTGCTEDEVAHQNMFSCRTGRCVHKSVVCKDLNPCGDQLDCTDGSAKGDDEGGKGLSFVKFIIITVVMVFAVFAIIQVCLIVRNEHGLCTTKARKSAIEVEFYPMSNGDACKVKPKDLESDSATNKDPASESLIKRDPV